MSTQTPTATQPQAEVKVANLAYIGSNSECIPHLAQFMGLPAETPVKVYTPDQLTCDKATLVGATFDAKQKLMSFKAITFSAALIVGKNEPMPGQVTGTNHSARGNITIPAEECSPELIEYAMLHNGIQNGYQVPGAGLKRNAEGRYESGSGWYSLTFDGEAVFTVGETGTRVITENGKAKQVLSTPLVDFAFNSLSFKKITIAGTETRYRSGWMAGASANVASERPVPQQTPAPVPAQQAVAPQAVTQEPNLAGM